MKRLTCLILAAFTLFLFAGCAKKEGDKSGSSDTSSYSVDIVALAEKGEISDLEFKLGDDVEQLKQKYDTAFASDQTNPELQIREGELTVQMHAEKNIYCYEKAKKQNGISVIACLDTVYGLTIGGVTFIDDAKAAIAKEPTEADATADDVFFLPALPENCKMLTYEMGPNVLKLFFVDDFLSAAVLYNPVNWSI